ncbi:hypothetical protein M1446_00335 [Candidatus Dependentiae bacterium]|nr:hypothetical protein [Candidatus Dependentiae bacterium]
MKRLLLSLLLLVPATNMFAEQPQKKEQSLKSVVAKTALGVGALAFSAYAGYKAYSLYQEDPIFTPTIKGKVADFIAWFGDRSANERYNLTQMLKNYKNNYGKRILKPIVAWGAASYASAVLGLVCLFRAAQ